MEEIICKKKSIRRKRTYSKQDMVSAVLFLVPALAIMFLFCIYPMVLSVKYSFTNWNGVSSAYKYVGFSNFINLVKDDTFLQVVKNTIYLAILYVPVLNFISFLFAAIIYDIGKKANIFKTVIFFSNLLSMVVVGFIWKLIYTYDGGLLNTVLNSLGLEKLTQDWLGNHNIVLPSMSLTIIWFATGFYLVIYLSGLTSIPVEMFEAAKIDGAGWFRKLLNITIPMIAPSITINLVISTIGILQFFDLPYVLTGGGPGYSSQTIALHVYYYAFGSLKLGYGMALALILTVFIIIISIVQLKILRSREEVY